MPRHKFRTLHKIHQNVNNHPFPDPAVSLRTSRTPLWWEQYNQNTNFLGRIRHLLEVKSVLHINIYIFNYTRKRKKICTATLKWK